jgi:hypothetical protein
MGAPNLNKRALGPLKNLRHTISYLNVYRGTEGLHFSLRRLKGSWSILLRIPLRSVTNIKSKKAAEGGVAKLALK